jgi:hypothetical protein
MQSIKIIADIKKIDLTLVNQSFQYKIPYKILEIVQLHWGASKYRKRGVETGASKQGRRNKGVEILFLILRKL